MRAAEAYLALALLALAAPSLRRTEARGVSLAAHAAQPNEQRWRLGGAFVSLQWASGSYAKGGASIDWQSEADAMAALGMDMAIVPAIAVGSSDVATDECPLGHFRSFYYQSGLKCVLSETPYDAGLLSKATAAFASRNISVYIGLAEPEAPFHQPWNRTGEALTAWLDAWADLQKTLLHDVWASLGASTSIVAGVYTNMELYNNPAFQEDAEQLAAHFYQPIADAASKLARPRSLDVLASPFYHGNTSNYKGELLSAAEYASVWNALRTSAPGLTKVALQDSVGWQGNSIAMAAEALDAFGSERALRGEHAWANIELFRATPAGCIFPESCGRAPAPWARVAAQLATEGPRASRLISWSG